MIILESNSMRLDNLFVCALLIAVALFTTACSDDDNSEPVPAPSATGEYLDGRDSTVYHYVRYGNLEWTTENLRYHVTTGTMPDLTPVRTDRGYYDDGVATKYYNSFGLLYDYQTAVASVPEGWRLPTEADWKNLDEVTHGNASSAIKLSLGGYFLDDEYFKQIHNVMYFTYVYGVYWIADDSLSSGENFARCRKISYNSPGAEEKSMKKSSFLSVRLVRDVK